MIPTDSFANALFIPFVPRIDASGMSNVPSYLPLEHDLNSAETHGTQNDMKIGRAVGMTTIYFKKR